MICASGVPGDRRWRCHSAFCSSPPAPVAAGWFVSNFQQIPADSQAVVMRFGSVARIRGAGLLLAWPRPIEQVVVLPAAARQLQLPIRRYEGNQDGSVGQGFETSSDPRFNSGFLLTGDSGVVHLEARLFYQISDPLAYMISTDHIEPALERLFLASAVTMMASRDMDSVLVARPEVASEAAEATRRERLRSDLMTAVNRRLAELEWPGGRASRPSTVSRVDLVPSIPAGAKQAFDTVLVVTQDVEARAAVARTSAEMTSQEANRNKDRIAANATAAAEEATTNAKAQTASIEALAQHSRDMSRSMQLTRVYYDRVEALLKKAQRVDVVDRSGAVRTILPGGKP